MACKLLALNTMVTQRTLERLSMEYIASFLRSTPCTQKRVEEYCKITGTSSPKAPPISETCIEQGTCTGKHEIFTLAMFESFKREFLELSRQLMMRLCETLVKILNFAGFSLKYLHGEENLQIQYFHLKQL